MRIRCKYFHILIASFIIIIFISTGSNFTRNSEALSKGKAFMVISKYIKVSPKNVHIVEINFDKYNNQYLVFFKVKIKELWEPDGTYLAILSKNKHDGFNVSIPRFNKL